MRSALPRLAVLAWLGLFAALSIAAEPQRNLAIAEGAGGGGKRIALVIGNAAYPGAAALKNPANDARDIAAKLKKLGFDVTVRTDMRYREMLRSLTEFGDMVQAGSEALFFYAGHGMQVRGRNYLIPLDAEIRTETSVSSEAVDVDQLLDKLSPARLSVVILDACRNNPFERRFRGGGQGLAQINAPTGTLIAYATAPGKVAADGEGRNGLYTSELLTAMDVPGIKIEDVFKRVRTNVIKRSGDAQTPWESSSLTGDFYFRPAEKVGGIKPEPVRLQTAEEIEQEFWDGIRDSRQAQDFEDYLKLYPNGRFIPLARQKLKGLPPGTSSPSFPSAAGAGNSRIGIAVPDFGGDRAIAQILASVLREDLERGAGFRLVAPGMATTMSPAADKLADVSARGANFYVAGGVAPASDGRHETRVRLFDSRQGASLGGMSYVHASTQARQTAHRMADFIYEKLTGEPGAFSGRIAYVVRSADRYQLQIADSDGANVQTAMASRLSVSSPVWSPDGASIAYVSYEYSKPELKHPHPVAFTQSLATGKRTVALNLPVGPKTMSIAWSPDGATLAIMAKQDNGSVFYTVSPQGTNVRLIASTTSQDNHPSFSRDGRQLYFSSDRSGIRRIYRASLSGGEAELVTKDGRESFSPAVSPNGETLAYLTSDSGTQRLTLMNLADGTVSFLNDSPVEPRLSFSANSQFVMFIGNTENGRGLRAASVKTHVSNQWKTALDGAIFMDVAFGPYVR
ncbi:MAG: caspase family protein [Sulfuritalea sp.]|nr:caspase family protein [Sulfuritalea sp.]